MRSANGEIILSPSDLMRFQGCAHAVTLDLAYLRGEPLEPAEDSADAVLLQRKGNEHEARYLKALTVERGNVAVIQKDVLSFEAAAEATREAMASGAPVICQAALATGRCQGYADFLERLERPSALGPFSYEVSDTKLKRRPDPKFALQLHVYSKAVADVQEIEPAHAHVVLGTNEKISLPTADFRHYAGRLVERLEAFIDAPWPTRPEPVSACGLCRWREHCTRHWEETDSLVLVAGITSSQRRKLETAGIDTLPDLARHDGRVPKLSTETLDKLRVQARLQFARRLGGKPSFERKTIEPGRGLMRLPKPSPADLFFDMEGDPHVVGGLEYLFGVYHETNDKPKFKTWWAHDEAQEQAALHEVLRFFVDHTTDHPEAFIYHYGHYEVTALKRLATRYGVGESLLDHLLRTKRFVDLYRVVQQGIIASEPGYSLKDLEAFYLNGRSEDVTTAGDSILAYEEWLETEDPTILDKIAAYNEVDCRSTKGLRDWLVAHVRPADLDWFVPQGAQSDPVAEDAEREVLRQVIEAGRARFGDEITELLFELNWFHKRADKPAWWGYFERQGHETEELIDDLECLGGLEATGRPDGQERTYRYPPQETKLRAGANVAIPTNPPINATMTGIDRRRRFATVQFPKKAGTPPEQVNLIPGQPYGNMVLRKAVERVTTSLAKGEKRYRAVEDFLLRRPPRVMGRTEAEPIIQGESEDEDTVAETVAAVLALDRTCLPIQGPPGTGKTYVSSCAILALVQAGHRVGVSSTSHKAINKLLIDAAERAVEVGKRLTIVKKISSEEHDPGHPMILTASDNDDPVLDTADVVGGTAWLFAREENDQAFHHVFIDEAGQVALANLLAIGSAAMNIVLVGDQMQLPQPVQGVHPGQSGLSTLDYMLEGFQTVPAHRGIFLPVSRRMHPAVCKLVSDLAYEGRLSSDGPTSRQRIDGLPDQAGLPPFGVRFVEVEHSGNSQSSEEEADAIEAAYRALLGATFTDRDGNTRTIDTNDILVVSPYNAQVNLLLERLPDGARVGTVDRFQGQEAPACLISMATSSGDELPRDIEFLFSLNRLNVAISRAQALAVLFASPRLLDVGCRTLDEMRLVNALCFVRAYARQLAMTGFVAPAL